MPHGLNPYFDADADETEVAINAAGGEIWLIEASNNSTGDVFVQLFDALLADVIVGTTAPTWSFFVPPGDGTNAGAMDKALAIGLSFDIGIVVAVTTGPADSGAPAANDVVLNIGWR